MSIKGASITATESIDNIVIDQYGSKIKITNINDINILIDLLGRLKSRYYSNIGYKNQKVYRHCHERGLESKTQ